MTSAGIVDVTSTQASLRRNFWSGVWRVMRRKPSRLLGVVLLAMFIFMATIGPMLSRPARDPNNTFAPPSLANPLGTDFQGVDVLSQLMSGSRYVLLTALITAVITVVLGTCIGLFAGFRRGRVDSILMRITDINLTIPGLPVLLVLSTVWQFSSPLEMGLVLGLLGWGALARAVRSQTLSLRERGFIEAARGLGLSTPHIVFRELLPPIAPYIAMNLLMSMVLAVWAQVGLFFLGVMPLIGDNWGVMLNRAVFDHGAMTTTTRMHLLIGPLLALVLLTVAFVLIVDAMDEVFNPRLREE
jgi:peptide/nickel transport system permease protein